MTNGFHRRRTPQTRRTWAQQKAAAQLHAQHVDGTPCRRCGQPMYRNQELQAGHPPGTVLRDNPDALPDALEHAQCNRKAGAREGARIRNNTPRTIRRTITSRPWAMKRTF